MKKNKNSKLLSNVKITDAEVKKYAKKLKAVSKGKLIGSIVTGVALVGGGVGATTYFATNRSATVEDKVVVMFDTNGGTAIDFKQVAKGSKLNEQEIKTTKEGCEFVGWYCDKNLTVPFDINTPVTANMNLYAKWHIPTSSVDYFSYEWYGDGYAVKVNEDKESDLPRYLSIPSTYKGKDVKYLYDPMGETQVSPISPSAGSISVSTSSRGAFEYCSKIVEIELPSSISYIPENCFRGCYSLKKVTLNGGISSIGTYAFAYCSALEEFKFNEGLLDIGQNAFCYCTSLKTVSLPDSLLRVGNYAFYECTGLTNAHFGNKLSYIGTDAFCYCYSLSTINLPASLTYISWGAFEGANITLSETTVGDQYSKWSVYDYDSGETIELDPVGKPAEFTNYLNNNYDYLITKNGYSSKEEEHAGLVFHYTGKDENGNDCCSVSYDYSYYGSVSESIDIPETIYFKAYPSTEVVVNKIEDLGFYGYYGSPKFTTITIPKTVTTIGYGAFNCNKTINTITIMGDYDTGSYNLKHIGDYAFYNSSIYNIFSEYSEKTENSCKLPEGLTDVGVAAFYNCDFNDGGIYIPASLTEISLGGYTSFTDPYGETSTIPAFSFAGCFCRFYVDKKNEWYTSDYYGGFYTLDGEDKEEALVYTTNYQKSTVYEIAEGTKKIYDTAFVDSWCSSIQTLYIPVSLESFNNSLLSDNLSALCSFKVEESKTETAHFKVSTDVGSLGLSNMLYGIDEDGNETEIVAYRPNSDAKGEEINYSVPDGIKSINVGAFKNATNIASIDFSYADDLETIGAYAFYNTRISIFDFPENVTELGINCFSNAQSQRYYIFNSKTLMNLTSSDALSNGMLEKSLMGVYVPKTLINDVSDDSFIKTLNMELYDEGEESPLPQYDETYRYFAYDY